jgi:hypothetical protein
MVGIVVQGDLGGLRIRSRFLRYYAAAVVILLQITGVWYSAPESQAQYPS